MSVSIPFFISSLVPRPDPKEKHDRTFFEAVKTITFVQWGLFFSGWLAWTCDAIDFFSVALTVPLLKNQFNNQVTSITTSITLTLLFRSVGALVFGLLSDRYGRKWPLVANLLIVAVLELGTGFVQTFRQFLALRSLFGIGMGGIWGLAAATALENLPVETRGIASGIIQEGYAVGYLIAAVINLYLVPKTSWRTLFWTAAGISAFAAGLRVMLPESEAFMRAKREADLINNDTKTRVFLREMKLVLKKHWLRCIYAVLLMTGFNFMSHGSQDLYPTYMNITKGFSLHTATVATIIGNCGAIAGGAIAGFISQYIGRRLTMIICVIFTGAFIPLWIIPNGLGPLEAGAFFLQVGVQGAWGIIPVYLTEISPPAFRTTFTGLAYQIGNMVSSASSQIEATGGAHLTATVNGKIVPDYATVQGIFMGVIVAYVLVLTIIGPENHASHFENARAAFGEGAADGVEIQDDIPRKAAEGDEHHSYDEKL